MNKWHTHVPLYLVIKKCCLLRFRDENLMWKSLDHLLFGDWYYTNTLFEPKPMPTFPILWETKRHEDNGLLSFESKEYLLFAGRISSNLPVTWRKEMQLTMFSPAKKAGPLINFARTSIILTEFCGIIFKKYETNDTTSAVGTFRRFVPLMPHAINSCSKAKKLSTPRSR